MIKHPQWILVVDHGYIRDWCRFEDGWNPVSVMGLTVGPISLKRAADKTQKGGAELYKRLSLRQREALEIDENYLQFLPYIVIIKRVEGRILFSNYTRTKLVGEARLSGKRSIGWGGHPDRDMMLWEGNGALNFKDSLNNCIVTEIGQECSFWGPAALGEDGSRKYDIGELSEDKGLLHHGFIYDRANDVGRKHLAVVQVLELPAHVEMASNEEELSFNGWATIDELKADLDKYEPWSNIIINAWMAGLMVPNDPKMVRPVSSGAPGVVSGGVEDNSIDELAKRLNTPFVGGPNQ
jgi:predicted NUDIX family phosphoesterase